MDDPGMHVDGAPGQVEEVSDGETFLRRVRVGRGGFEPFPEELEEALLIVSEIFRPR